MALGGGAFHGGGHRNPTPDNRAKLGVGRIPLKTWPTAPDGYTVIYSLSFLFCKMIHLRRDAVRISDIMHLKC